MMYAQLTDTYCVVLGVESQIGLSLVRELGEAGVRVIAMTDRPDAIGLVSNKVWRSIVVGPARSAIWLEVLRELGSLYPNCSLITVSEVNLKWLNEHRESLRGLHLALPDANALSIVLDKQKTLAAASAVGIAIPRTEEPQSLTDVERVASNFPFPAVLKWKDPNVVAPVLARAGISLQKAEYIYTREELLAAGRRYADIGVFPLVQQYCSGKGLGQFLFMHCGRSVRCFQHLRVAEWPPEGGFSSVCDTLAPTAHAKLMAQSEQLLQQVGWSGVAMVEYRWDAAKQTAWLMEINGRFWGSLPLAYHAGAGFALLTHAAALGLHLPTFPTPKHPLRCRMFSTEFKRLIRMFFQRNLITDRRFQCRPWHDLARFLFDYVRPNRCFYVFQWRDPKPWFADIGNVLGVRLVRRY